MIARIIVSILFLLFAIVQLNDPDPWLWVLLYGLTSGIWAWSVFGPVSRKVVWTGLAIIIIALLSLLPDFINWLQMGMPTITASMKAEAPHIELTREFLGLILCGLAWGWLLKTNPEA